MFETSNLKKQNVANTGYIYLETENSNSVTFQSGNEEVKTKV